VSGHAIGPRLALGLAIVRTRELSSHEPHENALCAGGRGRRWVAALVNAHESLLPTGVIVAALLAEPHRVEYYTLPRRLLERYRALPDMDLEAPGPFRYSDLERVNHDFAAAGFSIDHVEEMEVTVFEAETETEVVDWVRAIGLTLLLNGLPEDDQRAWELDLAQELRRIAAGGLLRLGASTRIVRAHKI
jgi:hypothetical protein